MKKKGVSPVIATILLISIVVILALIIFLWARNFVGERAQKFGSAIEYSCGGDTGVKMEAGVYLDSGNYQLDVINRGNVPIYGFVIKELSKGTVLVKDIPNTLGSVNIGESRSIELGSSLNADELLVVPIILGEAGTQRQAYTCGDEYGYVVAV